MISHEQLLHDDTRARQEALDISRSFIIQAPAGSGKTELLIQRYLKLLTVVESPEEVVAITFTRKAAAEMQLRVIDALRNWRSEDLPDAEHERQTFNLAGAVLQRDAAHDWNLLTNPRRLRIITLDALNASIARARPLSAPGALSRVVVGTEMHALYAAAATATLDWLTEAGPLADATLDVLRHLDNNTWLYSSYLSQMLGTRDQWLPFVGSGLLNEDDADRVRQQFEANLEFAVSEHLQKTAKALSEPQYSELVSVFDYAAQNLLAVDASDNPICHLAGRSDIPASESASVSAWQGIAELLLTRQGQIRKRVDKRQGFPAGDKARKELIHGLLGVMAENEELAKLLHGARSLPPVHYSPMQWQVLLALFRLLPLAATELKRLFAEQARTDHIEVALTASAALGSADDPGDIALLLDYQLRHLLVDEMQDTSGAQYRMLETLVAGWEQGDGRTLCCVGDPMQSIYRFRNAEVGQFLLTQQYGIGQLALEPLLLRRNFRSGEFLVDWFNTVFPTVLAQHDDPLHGAVAYSEATPVTPLQGLGRCETHAVFSADSRDEAAAGCALIRRILESKPDDNLAILVRGRTQLPQLLAELRSAGISYNAIEIDRLTDLPEIIDVLALTRAAVHQGDRIAWLALLRSPWIGLDWTDLHKLTRNNRYSTVWELVNDESRRESLSAEGRAAISRTLPILEAMVAPRRSQSLRDLVEQLWYRLGGPALLSDRYAVENVYRFLEVISAQEVGGTLQDVGELESMLDLERVSSSESARLQVMTIHRAKGLQFDHVLLYGLGRQAGKSDRRVLSWFDLPTRDGIERKVISPVGSRADVDNDPVHRFIELTEAEKERHEQARLLYVACTRAKKSLHLMGHTTTTPEGDDFRAARADSLLSLIWPAVEPEFARQFPDRQLAEPQGEVDEWVLPKLRRFASAWQLPEIEMLDAAEPVVSAPDNADKVEFSWVGSNARIAGVIVHRWLQCLSENAGGDFAYSRDVCVRWLNESGLDAVAADTVANRVELAIESMLSDAKGRWILEGEGHTELSLSGLWEGDLVSVVLDRVRIDENGTHWIIDYKTSSHEGGDLRRFLSEEKRRYEPQLARYAALYSAWAGGTRCQCALYFPLLKTFLEVPLETAGS